MEVVTEAVQPSRQLQHARVAGVRWERGDWPPSSLCCYFQVVLLVKARHKKLQILKHVCRHGAGRLK